jgi:hypothetical protein
LQAEFQSDKLFNCLIYGTQPHSPSGPKDKETVLTSQTMLQHYRLTEPEIKALHTLQPLVEPVIPRLTDNFYEFLQTIPETAKFLRDGARLERLQQYHQRWVLELFAGPFDDHYFSRLQRLGHVHVQIGLPPHYVSVAMNYIRIWLEKFIAAETNPEDQSEFLEALLYKIFCKKLLI